MRLFKYLGVLLLLVAGNSAQAMYFDNAGFRQGSLTSNCANGVYITENWKITSATAFCNGGGDLNITSSKLLHMVDNQTNRRPQLTSDYFVTFPGQTLTFTGNVWITNCTSALNKCKIWFKILYYDGAGNWIKTDSSSVAADTHSLNQWWPIGLARQAPLNAAKARVRIEGTNAGMATYYAGYSRFTGNEHRVHNETFERCDNPGDPTEFEIGDYVIPDWFINNFPISYDPEFHSTPPVQWTQGYAPYGSDNDAIQFKDVQTTSHNDQVWLINQNPYAVIPSGKLRMTMELNVEECDKGNDNYCWQVLVWFRQNGWSHPEPIYLDYDWTTNGIKTISELIDVPGNATEVTVSLKTSGTGKFVGSLERFTIDNVPHNLDLSASGQTLPGHPTGWDAFYNNQVYTLSAWEALTHNSTSLFSSLMNTLGGPFIWGAVPGASWSYSGRSGVLSPAIPIDPNTQQFGSDDYCSAYGKVYSKLLYFDHNDNYIPDTNTPSTYLNGSCSATSYWHTPPTGASQARLFYYAESSDNGWAYGSIGDNSKIDMLYKWSQQTESCP